MGIPIGVDFSWFLIFGLLSWSLAQNYFPGEFKDWPTYLYWFLGMVTSLLLFASVLLHELGHSYMARRFDLPVRSITLMVFGGVAQIAGEPRSARAEFWIALAGPLVSFLIGAVLYLVEPLVREFAPLLAVVKYLAYINIILAVFNLIPGFPLDGGRVFRAIVWAVTHNLRKATIIAGNVGRFFAFLFIYFGMLQIFTGNVGNGLWIIFIGWFLESAASAQIHQQELHDLLSRHQVADAMNRYFAIVPADLTLQEIMDQHILGAGRRSLVVFKNDRLIGLLTLHALKEIPIDQWRVTTAEQVMVPFEQLKWVTPETNLWEALQEMDRDGVNQLPVIEEGKIVGILSREDLISFLRSPRFS